MFFFYFLLNFYKLFYLILLFESTPFIICIYVLETIFPSFNSKILSACFAISKLCVTITKVCFNFLFRFFRRLIMFSEFLLSKFPVGSSANIIEGEYIKPLPIATLCCCPPDNWFGKKSLLSFISNISKILSNLFLLIFRWCNK